jgi:hypothetical protein
MQLAASLANEYSIKCDVCGVVFNVAKNDCTVDYEQKIIYADFLCSCGHTQKSVAFKQAKPIQRDNVNAVQGGNVWISGMKIIAWIAFIGIILCGVLLGVSLGQGSAAIGFVVFIASVIVAFLSVAMLMIFLNLAQDVSTLTKDASEIKQLLRKIRVDKTQR